MEITVVEYMKQLSNIRWVMKEIIINADDFGRTHEVNLAIVRCFQLGYIQRTTLMVNMPYADEAVKLAKDNNFADKVGLHINLGEGKPVNEETIHSFLCDNDELNSCINKRRLPAWKIIFNKREQKVIRGEVDSQIQKYIKYGFECNHLDSHRHVHYNMGIIFSLMTLLRKYGFKSIRVRNADKGGSIIERIFYNLMMKRLSLNHTDYFFSLREWEKMDKTRFSKNSIELSVHPFLSDDGNIMDSKGRLF